MPIAMTLDAFCTTLGAAPERVLMLDYDGTLAPFQVDPARALPWPGVVEALNAIARVPDTRLVIVSGRPARELPALLQLDTRPEIWGTHGWERLMPDGSLQIRMLAAPARQALHDAERLGAEVLALGARLEKKSASIALHWRGLDAEVSERISQWARHAWAPLTGGRAADGAGADTGLALLPFDGGLELRARECSKALAVTSVLESAHPQAAIAYLGDDITDEDAFTALKHRGLGVLVRAEPRQTAADARLTPPGELLAFLARWHAPG
jgi:trehalose-phosphatase